MIENSWTISMGNQYDKKYYHYYICKCSSRFTYLTDISESQAPDVICPHCGDDYFKDADEFYLMQKTKIWKDFQYAVVLQEKNDEWIVAFEYDIPLYDKMKNDIIIKTERLMSIALAKDGYGSYRITYDSEIVQKYSLFKDAKVQALKKLLLDEAKEKLYSFIIEKQYKYDTFVIHSSQNRLETLRERIMIDFVARQQKAKSIKKALYEGYENAISKLGFYPYADYIFSYTISNIDLLKQLYEIETIQKRSIFLNYNYSVGIDFLHFLKQHYTEKQLVKFFTKDLKNIEEQNNWRDTLRMLQTDRALGLWQNHFLKVKLTPKRLHDEMIRVFHIVSYELQAKEKFDYQKKYIFACSSYQGLDFQLPQTVAQLSLWSQLLHNCMFGYSQQIHKQHSVIYGVFQNEDLLYAVELRGTNIVQAKASFNHSIAGKHRTIIQDWWSKNF